MQDIHAIGGGGGGGAGGGARLFAGVGGGGDRRLRPHHAHHHQNNQALKCPRCDSLNTKFCYYNNYNSSQPRHFCKSCRRYWTKGGVLRNVPVGGGCRKTKRSKPKQTATTSAAETATTPPQQQEQQEEEPQDPQQQQNNNNNKSSNSHTSSESSSLTATNTTPTANTTVEAVSSKVTAKNNGNMFNGSVDVETSNLFSTNPSFEQGIYEQYPEIGNFTGLMASSSSENMSFGFSNVMNQQTTSAHEPVHQQQQQSLWQGGLIDQTVQNELTTLQNSGSREGESGGGFGALDWQVSGDQGLFDLPNAVDQAYWSENQWSNNQDHHAGLYLP